MTTVASSGAALARRKVTVFLVLVTVLVSTCYIWMFRSGNLGQLGVSLLMWMPGLAALLTQLITVRSLKGLGWRPRTAKLLGLALVLPLLYALPVYGLTWLTGLGQFDPAGWQAAAGGIAVLPALGLLLTAGLVQSLFTALGEEIGWRGLLVPQLAQITSLRNMWLISSAVWLLFHAAHNLIVQGIFDAGTKPGALSPFVTGEFGAGLVITIGLAGWLLWRRGLAQPG